MVIAIATVFALGSEVLVMVRAMQVTLADLLLLFLYLEVLAMVGLYYHSGRVPVRFPLYIAMVALARYLILDMKAMASYWVSVVSMILLASPRCSTIRAQEVYAGRCECRRVVSPYAVERAGLDGGARMPWLQPIGYAPIAPRIALAPINQSFSGAAMENADGPYYVGRGVLGQKKLFATGQPLRNVLRFITP